MVNTDTYWQQRNHSGPGTLLSELPLASELLRRGTGLADANAKR